MVDQHDAARATAGGTEGDPLSFEHIESLCYDRVGDDGTPDGWDDDEPPAWLVGEIERLVHLALPYVRLCLPCRMIGFAQSPVDVAHDFLLAAHVGQRLAPMVRAHHAIQEPRGLHGQGLAIVFVFTVDPAQAQEFARELVTLAQRFGEMSLDWSPDAWHLAGVEDLDEFAGRLWDVQEHLHRDAVPPWSPTFPELCDDWLLNFLRAPEDVDGTEEDVLRVQPSYADGYVLSFSSPAVGGRVYLSQDGWFTSPTVDPARLLTSYSTGDGDGWRLERAQRVAVNAVDLAVGPHGAVRVPTTALRAARRIARRHLPKARVRARLPEVAQVVLSDNGRALVAIDTVAAYYFFDEALRPAGPDVLSAVAADLDRAADDVRALLGRPREIAVPWAGITDEVFERFCYDLIRAEFVSNDLRLMGKTRSRDGGRDITFAMPAVPGRPPVRWIAQCKFSLTKAALGSKDVRDVGDMLDQYNADGYLLITNVLIDPTLFDRLDGVTARRGAALRTWASPELEHLLTQHREIRQRYFASQPAPDAATDTSRRVASGGA